MTVKGIGPTLTSYWSSHESAQLFWNCFLGACIIDRDGHLFKYILDYLHGEVQTPSDEQTRTALQEEADYFGIPYPYSLSDHLANEMETYSLRSNIELKKVLAFSQVLKYIFICTKQYVILHSLWYHIYKVQGGL